MAAPTTFQDLPDDMLLEIFERVIVDEPEVFFAMVPPKGAHLALRSVYRRWRDISDWVHLSTTLIAINTELADDGAIRARHPAAVKTLLLACRLHVHSTSVSRAAASLFNGSADLRRALSQLTVHSCCLPSISPAVAPIASCTALTQLAFFWHGHKKERVAPSNMLAPLSALRMLGVLAYGQLVEVGPLSMSAMLAPLPTLPDAPRLTSLILSMTGNFVPVGSDAALGRLRRLAFAVPAPERTLVDAEDPFLLRAAVDTGTWQPSRLTGLQELYLEFGPVRDSNTPLRPSRTGSRAGSEWAPLAGQVTKLTLDVESDYDSGYRRLSTGIVAGLGALTALRELRALAKFPGLRPGWREPVSLDRLRAPHLSYLDFNCISTPANLARFPNLVALGLASVTRQPPLNLRSLVARSSMKDLNVVNQFPASPSLINLAELFIGGAGWPVLELCEFWRLVLYNIVLEWDTTGLVGAPTAAEFEERARQLLPALVRVQITEPRGRNALPDRSRVGFVLTCRRHVVPALLGLRAAGK